MEENVIYNDGLLNPEDLMNQPQDNQPKVIKRRDNSLFERKNQKIVTEEGKELLNEELTNPQVL